MSHLHLVHSVSQAVTRERDAYSAAAKAERHYYRLLARRNEARAMVLGAVIGGVLFALISAVVS